MDTRHELGGIFSYDQQIAQPWAVRVRWLTYSSLKKEKL